MRYLPTTSVLLIIGIVLSCVALAAEDDAHGAHAHATVAAPSDAGAAWRAADARLREEFSRAWRAAADKRPVFAAWLDRLSVPAMLGFLESEDPRCHGDAHDLGKALYAANQDLGESLMLCGNGCTNACMHGVVAAAFGDRGYDEVVRDMDRFCTQGDMADLHKPGNCAHGIGHALMLVTAGEVAKSVAGCAGFVTPGMAYYCATGVYMEYRDRLDAGAVAAAVDTTDVCERARFPAACYRYMLSHVAQVQRLSGVQLIERCLALDDRARRGCFHGLGAMYSRDVADDPSLLGPLCLRGAPDDQLLCIEGVIEKLADFDEQRAVVVCGTLEGDHRRVCLEGARGKMYRLDRATASLYQ